MIFRGCYSSLIARRVAGCAALFLALPLGAQTFYGAAASALTSGHQRWSASAIIATEIKQSEVYSFSETDWIYTVPSGGGARRLQSSVRTGVATKLRCYGAACLYGLADAGAATTGAATGAAYAGGGVLVVPFRGKLNLLFGARIIKSNVAASQAVVSLGLGGAF